MQPGVFSFVVLSGLSVGMTGLHLRLWNAGRDVRGLFNWLILVAGARPVEQVAASCWYPLASSFVVS